MKCIFLGAPGAGKGTLAVRVSEVYGIPHISTGEIFRAAIRDKTALGLQVKSILDSGALVSDDLTIALVKDRLAQNDTQNGFILDGFPRTIAQADALKTISEIDTVVNFDISDDEVITRLSGRRLCPACGKGYHVQFMPSKTEGICDVCGAALIIRDDDKIEVISKRLEAYKAQTAPLIDFYRKEKLLTDIDARPSVAVILTTFEHIFPKK